MFYNQIRAFFIEELKYTACLLLLLIILIMGFLQFLDENANFHVKMAKKYLTSFGFTKREDRKLDNHAASWQ